MNWLSLLSAMSFWFSLEIPSHEGENGEKEDWPINMISFSSDKN